MTNNHPALDFSFANFADGFEEHINQSVRGYSDFEMTALRSRSISSKTTAQTSNAS